MKAWILGLVLLAAACGPIAPPVPVPPRPPNVPFTIGITFGPFSAQEWSEFAWTKLWRVEQDQAADVVAHGGRADFLAECEDDQSVTNLLAILQSGASDSFFEMGNECNYGHDPVSTGQWWQRVVVRLRDNGYAGQIITGGIANLEPDTVQWWKDAAAAAQLQPDIVAGWHAYSNWNQNLGAWLVVLNGRPHAMTESGYPETLATEQAVAAQFNADVNAVYGSGSLMYVAYQLHDGQPNTPQNNFGLIEWATGRVRPAGGILQQWSAR